MYEWKQKFDEDKNPDFLRYFIELIVNRQNFDKSSVNSILYVLLERMKENFNIEYNNFNDDFYFKLYKTPNPNYVFFTIMGFYLQFEDNFYIIKTILCALEHEFSLKPFPRSFNASNRIFEILHVLDTLKKKDTPSTEEYLQSLLTLFLMNATDRIPELLMIMKSKK